MTKICHEHCPSSSSGLGILAVYALIAILAVGFVATHMHAIVHALVIAGVAIGAFTLAAAVGYASVLLKRQQGVTWGDARESVTATQLRALPPATARVEAARQRPAIAPVQQHLHLHGVTAEDIATMLARQAVPVSLEEDQ